MPARPGPLDYWNGVGIPGLTGADQFPLPLEPWLQPPLCCPYQPLGNTVTVLPTQSPKCSLNMLLAQLLPRCRKDSTTSAPPVLWKAGEHMAAGWAGSKDSPSVRIMECIKGCNTYIFQSALTVVKTMLPKPTSLFEAHCFLAYRCSALPGSFVHQAWHQRQHFSTPPHSLLPHLPHYLLHVCVIYRHIASLITSFLTNWVQLNAHTHIHTLGRGQFEGRVPEGDMFSLCAQ